MSRLFNRLPGHPRTLPGRERQILRMLPRALAIGTAMLALPSLAVRGAALFNPLLGAGSVVMSVDIYSISLVVLHWTLVVTVAIGCTGGQHRSVFMVEQLAQSFGSRWLTLKRHRELDAL